MPQTMPDYHTLTNALTRLDTEVTPSEVHGTLAGLLCAHTGAGADVWQQALWPNLPSDDLLAAEAREVFQQVHEATRRQLNDPTCDFEMLLPDDDAGLDIRVHALGDWCQGFLLGLSLGGVKDFAPLPEDAREIANDMLEISRAGSSYDLEGSEEDENAYAELVEYLRVGVLLINEELQPTQAAPITVDTDATLH
ncbi:MAG TPA: YecA family protein [Gammaproteobacteria bacterium]|nr:YecA family protein [Gammaproteobacteria bacterium]